MNPIIMGLAAAVAMVSAHPVNLDCPVSGGHNRLLVGRVIMGVPNVQGDPREDGVLARLMGKSILIESPANYFYAVHVHNAAVIASSCKWLTWTEGCDPKTQHNQVVTTAASDGSTCELTLDYWPTRVEIGYSNAGPPVRIFQVINETATALNSTRA